jgi:succinate dehydrogenase / fumarate reductase cytochrome b subunit
VRIPERTPEWLRRIHSLTGVIPLGVFLLEHVAVNSSAIAGPSRFRAVVGGIHGIPGIVWIEALGIGLPLLAHMTLGVLIATELDESPPQAHEVAPATNGKPASFSTWITWSQRLTGIYLLNYVAFHVWGTRLSPELLQKHRDLYAIMHEQVRGAGNYLFNTLGVLAAAWHLGLGLPRFVARWWPEAPPARLRAFAVAGFILSTALGIAGVASLSAFARVKP